MIRRPPRSTLFPYTSSSDLWIALVGVIAALSACSSFDVGRYGVSVENVAALKKLGGDRKSTRLNSSHSSISYAVFCLKKKKMYTIVQNLASGTISRFIILAL